MTIKKIYYPIHTRIFKNKDNLIESFELLRILYYLKFQNHIIQSPNTLLVSHEGSGSKQVRDFGNLWTEKFTYQPIIHEENIKVV